MQTTLFSSRSGLILRSAPERFEVVDYEDNHLTQSGPVDLATAFRLLRECSRTTAAA